MTEEKKGDDVEATSELGTKIATAVDSIESVLKQLGDDEKTKDLVSKITQLKTDIICIQKDEQKSNKETISLKQELKTLKKKFGALKWDEVKAKGYPKARRDEECIDTYKNAKGDEVKVNDAYQWLEDPDSKESRDWIDDQVDVCSAYLNTTCGDDIDKIYNALEENMNFPRYSTPSRKGKDPIIYYYTYNSGLQNQSVLYFHKNSLDEEKQELIDPNTLSEDGTTALKGYYFSEDAKYLCYGISKAGSDWTEYHVKVKWFSQMENSRKFRYF